MANQPSNSNEEIDLGRVSQNLKKVVSRSGDKVFDFILFLKRNIILAALVILTGIAYGWYLDRGTVYQTKIFVTPNFGSVDYLYQKVDLVNSKISEHDDDLYAQTGLGDNVGHVKIEPVVDVYKFVEGGREDNRNYEILKLLAESGDIGKVMEDVPTGKNYKTHLITITTRGKTTREASVEALLKFFNDNPYYQVILKEGRKNLERKIAATDTTLVQINKILNHIPRSNGGTTVSYSEDGSLDDVIELKNSLIDEQAENRIALINAENLIHESGAVLNERNTKGLIGKNKFVMPVIFFLIFMGICLLIKFYRSQMEKRSAAGV